MMAAIVVPLGCLSRARMASCLVPPRVEPKGMFEGFAGLFARLLARANVVFLGILLCDIFCCATFEDPFRLRRRPVPSPPKPRSGTIASRAGIPGMGPAGPYL